MKLISYKIVVSEPEAEEIILQPMRRCCPEDAFETQYAIAKAAAYNGEVIVEKIEDPVTEPTQLDRIEAQVAYIAMMTDILFEEE